MTEIECPHCGKKINLYQEIFIGKTTLVRTDVTKAKEE